MNIPTVSQNEIGNIYKERLENPGLYVEKPVVIWRSYFEDGIQEPILEKVNDTHNEGRKEKEYFRVKPFDVEDLKDKDFEVSLNPEKHKACVFYVELPEEELENPATFDAELSTHVSEWLKKITAKLNVPVILHLPFIEPDESPNGIETIQYVFSPDYEEWKRKELEADNIFDKLLFGFLDTFKSHQEEDYSFYWYFHRSPDWKPEWYFQTLHKGTGCNFPSCWSDGLYNLRRYLYFPKAQIPKNYKPREDILISEMPVEKFKSFFEDGISDDLIEGFRQHLIEHHNVWEDPYK